MVATRHKQIFRAIASAYLKWPSIFAHHSSVISKQISWTRTNSIIIGTRKNITMTISHQVLITLLSLAAVVSTCIAAPGEYIQLKEAGLSDNAVLALRKYLAHEVSKPVTKTRMYFCNKSMHCHTAQLITFAIIVYSWQLHSKTVQHPDLT